MKYRISLFRQDNPNEEVKTRTIKSKKMTLKELKGHLDSVYFGYVEGPPGLDHYPAVIAKVVESEKVRTFRRRADSNAAGFPDLWVEGK